MSVHASYGCLKYTCPNWSYYSISQCVDIDIGCVCSSLMYMYVYYVCLFRFRRECDIQKEEVKRLRQESADGWRECEEKRQEIEKLQKRVEKLKNSRKISLAYRRLIVVSVKILILYRHSMRV